MSLGEKRQVERAARALRERLPEISRSGGRMPPVRELAAQVGVSVMTLRAAQKALARDGLLEIRHGSGVYLTERAKPRWIGIYTALNVLLPRTSSFHTVSLNALREYFTRYGFRAEIYIGQSVATAQATGQLEQQPSNPRFVEDVAAGRLAGVALLAAPETQGWADWIDHLRIPAVGANTAYRVDARYEEMVGQSVRHLVRQGCRRIALLSFSPSAGESALKSALAGCGLDYHREWIRQDLHPMLSGAGWEEFREIWTARREKPDGLLVADDVLFDEARIAIQELGIRVPDELRIVTHANKGAIRRYPFPVTEVQIDAERYAETLGGLLLKRLRGEAVEPPTVTLPFELVEARPVATPVEAACHSAKSAKAAAFASCYAKASQDKTKHEPPPLSQAPERDEGVASTNSVAAVTARIVPHEVAAVGVEGEWLMADG